MLTHNRTPLVLKAEVKFSIPGISTKSSDSEASLKTLTLAEFDKSYTATAWTQVFTDGSAENATRKLQSHMKKIGSEKSAMYPRRTGRTNHSPCPAVMPSPQKRKRKHLTNRKFPRKQTPWKIHLFYFLTIKIILVWRMKRSRHGDYMNGDVAKTGDKSSIHCWFYLCKRVLNRIWKLIKRI